MTVADRAPLLKADSASTMADAGSCCNGGRLLPAPWQPEQLAANAVDVPVLAITDAFAGALISALAGASSRACTTSSGVNADLAAAATGASVEQPASSPPSPNKIVRAPPSDASTRVRHVIWCHPAVNAVHVCRWRQISRLEQRVLRPRSSVHPPRPRNRQKV